MSLFFDGAVIEFRPLAVFLFWVVAFSFAVSILGIFCFCVQALARGLAGRTSADSAPSKEDAR